MSLCHWGSAAKGQILEFKEDQEPNPKKRLPTLRKGGLLLVPYDPK